jgi:hypothetical protein
MKQAMNFRFDPKTIAILHQLEEQLNLSKTAVLEQALQYYAKKKLFLLDNPLLQFAGKISEKEADSLLNTIKTSRKNRSKETKL